MALPGPARRHTRPPPSSRHPMQLRARQRAVTGGSAACRRAGRRPIGGRAAHIGASAPCVAPAVNRRAATSTLKGSPGSIVSLAAGSSRRPGRSPRARRRAPRSPRSPAAGAPLRSAGAGAGGDARRGRRSAGGSTPSRRRSSGTSASAGWPCASSAARGRGDPGAPGTAAPGLCERMAVPMAKRCPEARCCCKSCGEMGIACRGLRHRRQDTLGTNLNAATASRSRCALLSRAASAGPRPWRAARRRRLGAARLGPIGALALGAVVARLALQPRLAVGPRPALRPRVKALRPRVEALRPRVEALRPRVEALRPRVAVRPRARGRARGLGALRRGLVRRRGRGGRAPQRRQHALQRQEARGVHAANLRRGTALGRGLRPASGQHARAEQATLAEQDVEQATR